MKRTFVSSLVLGPALLLGALLLPAAAAAAGPITSSACTAVGTDVTCNLWAETGSLTLPPGSSPSSVPVWGFSTTDGGSPVVPGPVLVADAGDTVTVNLVNHLGQTTSIVFDGQAMVPDTTGVAAGGSTSYTFTAGAPGTYLYEAGLMPGTQYQAAMGMYGVLVVRPAGAPGQAYDDAATAFDDEALVVLGEIDPTLNQSATPWTFDLRQYAPRFQLINGTAHPVTPAITTTGGNALLLRFANAGIQHHSMGVLGLRQSVLAADGSPLHFPRDVAAETIAPGQTADVLVAVPSSTAASTKYAVYDANLLLNNNGGQAFGGMLTFIDAAPSGTSGGDTTGPVTSGATVAETAPGSGLFTLTATVDDSTTGGANVAAAEYAIDNVAAAPTALAAADGAFDTPVEGVTSAAGEIDTSAWTSGNHVIYVRGQDALGNWGTYAFTSIYVDKTGPTTSGLTLAPARSNGTVDVALSGSATDAATGNANVTAAEYTIDGGVATAINVTPAPTVSLAATIPAATVNALTDGGHTIAVRSQDALGNWGSTATITLHVDRLGPATTNVSANPNPTTGLVGFNSTTQAVRVTASFSDIASGSSPIATAKALIDDATGDGFPFSPSDGLFNTSSETGYADIPLSTIVALSPGNHTIHVFARDAAGNWGPEGTVVLVKLGDDIFADSFGSGDTSAWSSTTGAVSVTAAASMEGSPAFGLQAAIAGPATGYVTDASPLAEPSYHARFYLDPNDAQPTGNNAGTGATIFAGLDGSSTTIFQVQLRRQNAGGGTYQVRLAVLRSGGTTTGAWYTISNAPQAIEIAWTSGTTASASLYTGGTLRETLSGLNTSAYKLESVRLGPSAGLVSSASGSLYFDGFVSRRQSYVGP